MSFEMDRFSRSIHEFVRDGFTPHFAKPKPHAAGCSIWERLNALRTELWLDTSDPSAIERLWSREFSAVTTNNSLLAAEVSKGAYDDFIIKALGMLADVRELDEVTHRLELAFMLNARHALKLVERFDAYVSVELHTELANDLEGTLHYGRRMHAICPERFYVKVPFSAAGLLATRRLQQEGIRVNHTLGFSARQNYVATRIGRPQWVNVFLGRLNAFVADNRLGSGEFVGEKATLASQAVVHRLRAETGVSTRQIAASFRSPLQVRDLAGVDIMTLPPKIAEAFLKMDLRESDLFDRTAEPYEPGIKVNPRQAGLETLWEVDDQVEECVSRLLEEDIDELTPYELTAFFEENGCGDLLVNWSEAQVRMSGEDGKIPRLKHWREALEARTIGLDSIMTLAGWSSFNADQEEVDRRVLELAASVV